MSILKSKSIRGLFSAKASQADLMRDKQADKHFADEAFFQQARERVYDDLVNKGKTISYFWPDDFAIKKRDAERLQPVFDRLKQELPGLDHFRIMRHGEVLFDTKPNTALRRLVTTTSATPAM